MVEVLKLEFYNTALQKGIVKTTQSESATS